MNKIFSIILLSTISLCSLAETVASTHISPRHYTLADVEPEARRFLEKMPLAEESYSPEAIYAIRMKESVEDKENAKKSISPVVTVADEWIDQPGTSEKLRLRIYRPNHAQNEKLPLIFYVHGGGMVMGTPEQDEEMLTHFAANIGAVVASPDYRLAPEHPFPVPFNDSYAALLWMTQGAGVQKYRIDTTRIVLGGASAGGNLALALALKTRNEKNIQPKLLLAIYPMLDETASTATGQSLYDNKLLLTNTQLKKSWEYYRGNFKGNSAYFDPYTENDFNNLPPVFMVSGTIDPLYGPALVLSEKMEKSGAIVRTKWYKGAVHSFDDFPTTQTRETITDWTEAFRTALKITE